MVDHGCLNTEVMVMVGALLLAASVRFLVLTIPCLFRLLRYIMHHTTSRLSVRRESIRQGTEYRLYVCMYVHI